MRTKLSILLALAVALAMMPMANADPGTLEEDIETSVVAGLAWLEAQQNPDGSFGGECDSIGVTGLAVLKFEDRAIDLGLDPLSVEYEYSHVVQAGLDYIMEHDQTMPIGPQPAGDPDGDGDGIGVFWDAICHPGHVIYNTGIAMMALAASGHPEIYGDALQDAVDFMAFAQEDDTCGVHRGGWRYEPNQCSSDNSTSGYATLGLGFAEASPPYGFDLTVPQFVKDELSLWIDAIQDPVNGDADDGGSHYTPGGGWVNTLKTGNLLYEMGLVGDGPDTARVLDAVDYLERHWNDIGSCGAGWLDHRQAMFTMMKGLEGLGIELLDLDGADPLDEWFPLVAQHLIATQNADGSWPFDCWGNQILSTSWALLTLEKAVPTFEIAVPVDIKPWSCRNPLNVKKRGVIPVAILGTEDFDVTQVDPASVQLVGVSPLRWNWHDVGTPYVPYLGKENATDCIAAGPDGFADLIFKFEAQEVIAALGEVNHHDVLVLPLTGLLKEEFGGTPIVGEDVIVIIKR